MINGVYLPGWEYNRILGTDPRTPRNSALPGRVLWNGGALFWMFENVYCTKESLENEKYAAKRIRWTSSIIFKELSGGLPGGDGPIIHEVDWSNLPGGGAELVEAHEIVQEKNPGRKVRELIDVGDDAALELINYDLIAPVADRLNSIVAGTLTSFRNWFPATDGVPEPPSVKAQRINDMLALIARPVDEAQARNGVRLLRPPSQWSDEMEERQKRVRAEVEEPFIRDLCAGEGEYSDPSRGFVPYIDRAATRIADYRVVDEPWENDWTSRKESLLRLREAASRHLWPTLHGDWIPALLRNDPVAVAEFPRYVSSALRSRRIAPWLNLNTRVVFGSLAAGSASIVGASSLIGHAALVQDIAAISGTLASLAMASPDRPLAPNVAPLALFYQEAFKEKR